MGRNGVRVGLGRRILTPNDIANLALSYDISKPTTLLTSSRTTPTAGQGVALVSDLSGNSSTNVLALNGSASQYASAGHIAAYNVTDLDLRMDMRLQDWTPAVGQCPVSKLPTGSNASFDFFINPTALHLRWSPTGSTGALVTASSTATIAFADYTRGGVRVTLDVNNGAGGYTVKFYTRTDSDISSNTGWTQLGADVVGVGTTSIFNSTASIVIGGSNTAAANVINGNIFRVMLMNAIDGTAVFDANFATASKLASSFTESSSNAATVTITSSGDLGARISGERDLVQLTSTKQPIYLPWTGANYGWIEANAGSFSTSSNALMSSTSLDVAVEINGYDTTANRQIAQVSGAWIFATQTTGSLRVRFNSSGLTDSSSTVALSSNTRQWVRFTYDGANVRFYTSTDGSTWTQLGADVANTTVVNTTVTTLSLGISGNFAVGWSGQIYNAVFRATIGGSIVYNFNPTLYSAGTTFVASTGETWTINNNALIVIKNCLYFDGSNDYMKAALFSLSQPDTVYFVGKQVTWTLGDGFLDGGTNISMVVGQPNPGSSPQINIYAGSNVVDTTGLAIGSNGILCGVFNGASSSLRINRNTPTIGNAGTTAANGFTLGAYGAAGAGWSNIGVSEVCVYSSAQDAQTQNWLITYFAAKWKILLSS